MINVLEIDGFHAVISFDPEINLFRGEFIDLNGGADFYAADVEALRREGRTSLKVFLDMCQEDGVEPRRKFSGRFNLRLPPELHRNLTVAAAAEGKSLNAWTVDHLQHATHD